MPLRIKIHKPRGKDILIKTVDMPFLLPHSVFHHLYHERRDSFFSKFIGATPESANAVFEKFWCEVVTRRDPRIIRHPMCLRDDWQKWAIPIALHGDAVPVVRVGKPGTSSLDCLSFQSLIPNGTTMDLKLPMFCVFEKNKLPGVGGMISTMDAVWTILAWSLTALFSGSFPTSDASGRQFKAADAQSLLVGSKLCEALCPFFVWSGLSKGIWIGTQNVCS